MVREKPCHVRKIAGKTQEGFNESLFPAALFHLCVSSKNSALNIGLGLGDEKFQFRRALDQAVLAAQAKKQLKALQVGLFQAVGHAAPVGADVFGFKPGVFRYGESHLLQGGKGQSQGLFQMIGQGADLRGVPHGRIAPQYPQGEHKGQAGELEPELAQVKNPTGSRETPRAAQGAIPDEQRGLAPGNQFLDGTLGGHREMGPPNPEKLRQKHAQQIDGGRRFAGQGDVAAGELLGWTGREQQYALHRAEGTDGEMGQQQVIAPMTGVLEGRGGTDIDAPLVQHVVERRGHPLDQFALKAGARQVVEKGRAVEVADLADGEAHGVSTPKSRRSSRDDTGARKRTPSFSSNKPLTSR